MAQPESSLWPPLYGREAVEWFRDRRQFAGAIFDFGFSALSEQFGRDRAVSAYVPPRQPPWQPRHFFLAVDGDVRSDPDWESLILTYRLLEQAAEGWSTGLGPYDDSRERRQFERELGTFQ